MAVFISYRNSLVDGYVTQVIKGFLMMRKQLFFLQGLEQGLAAWVLVATSQKGQTVDNHQEAEP